MKCHYEVLGVDISCTADDLKKAYRKLALEWHPDKNLDRLEEAKETFQSIQQAYEILTDPQERAWYDRHRDDILRGGAEEAYKDDCLDVYQFFNTGCFKGYNDDEKGFYTVYREVFEKIAAEDQPFIDDEEEDIQVPSFGYSHSSYEEVVHNFYAYWQSYCTYKSYSWNDKFDLTEARKSGVGRQMLRLMEKENKKLRDQHKKQRNEEIRELVAFVRKRDKRVQAHKKKMEEIKAEKAKKAEELRRKQVQERNKTLENYKESEWASMSQFEDHFNQIESTLDMTFGNDSETKEDDDIEEFSELYCAACEKDFRSEQAMRNHENSKKHKANVAMLKEYMEEDDEESNQHVQDDANSQDNDENRNCIENEDTSSAALLEELMKSATKTKKKKKKKNEKKEEQEHVPNEEQEIVSETLESIDLQLNQVHIDNDVVNEEKKCDSSEKLLPADTTSNPSNKIEHKKKKKEKPVKKVDVSEATEETEQPITLCETCNKNFSSRNKLFEHLKQSGHASYKNDTSQNTSKKQRRKKL
ncbi:dnaJ homolog subfamily C member 21-like [Uloborus diversus]|uniref:dnaJ homolog subfamily C member 21-like n=1 Tax=Uloborus diversus TaxID=327109 RepID=UPI0024098BE9|nr:dnaJ homolog subfamily C member 21-like [Uloborus diversus]